MSSKLALDLCEHSYRMLTLVRSNQPVPDEVSTALDESICRMRDRLMAEELVQQQKVAIPLLISVQEDL